MLETLGIDFKLILVMLAGFLLLVFILSKFAFGPILNLLGQRQATIQGNMDEAQARRDEMVRLQHDYEDRLAKSKTKRATKIRQLSKKRRPHAMKLLPVPKPTATRLSLAVTKKLSASARKSLILMRDQVADLAIGAASKVSRPT
jgi:F-type H+-transporting ATPase subunit b